MSSTANSTVKGSSVKVAVAYDVINESQQLSDATLAKWVEAAQIQADRDCAPIWGATAKLTIVNQVNPANATYHIRDQNPDGGGFTAKHDLGDNGLPVAFGYMDSRLDSILFCHEVLETIADPLTGPGSEIDNTIWKDVAIQGHGIVTTPQEIGDPVETNSYNITIGDGSSVKVSDFTLPAWYSPTVQSGGKYDFTGACDRSGQILHGGYIATKNGGEIHGPVGGVHPVQLASRARFVA